MTWIQHHSDEGVADCPHVVSFDARIHDYWVNDTGVRIGYVSRRKGIALFTYRKGDLNFEFHASSMGPKGDGEDINSALGPVCCVVIKRQRLIERENEATWEYISELFKDHQHAQVKTDIESFLCEIGLDLQIASEFLGSIDGYDAVAVQRVIFRFDV